MNQKSRSLRSRLRLRAFRFAEKHLGVHVTPVHFYSPIPNLDELKSEVFTRASECVGLDFCAEQQLSDLQRLLPLHLGEYTPPVNPGLAQVDAYVLYSTIRRRKPGLLIEIGSGESTRISLAALRKNAQEGAAGRMIAVEPYPKAYLKQLPDEDFQLIESKVQEVDFHLLASADILFIDSSHVTAVGSDVNYEILEIVPRLKVGAIVHWHDIMIPMNYSREWMESGQQFWNESYVVHAFMLHNKCFRVIWAARYMQLNFAAQMRATFPYFRPSDPDQQLSSFWIERVA